MIYLTTTQNQYENVYGTEIWNTSLNGVTLEDNVKETVLARIAQIKTMYLLAKEKEVTLDEAEEAKVVQAAQEYYSSLMIRRSRLWVPRRRLWRICIGNMPWQTRSIS